MEELDTAAVSYQIVLTKADKMKPGPLQRMVGETETAVARNPAAHPSCLTTSSASGAGVAELRAALAALAEPAPGGQIGSLSGETAARFHPHGRWYWREKGGQIG